MEEHRDLRLHLLMVIISVAGAGMIAWMELPPDQRMMAMLTIKARLHRFLHLAARRAGYLGMGSELAGHPPAAEAGYGIAYRLARWRDRL